MIVSLIQFVNRCDKSWTTSAKNLYKNPGGVKTESSKIEERFARNLDLIFELINAR